MIELYHKLAPQNEDQRKLWKKLESIRRKYLAENQNSGKTSRASDPAMKPGAKKKAPKK
jgi:hypothetical protein